MNENDPLKDKPLKIVKPNKVSELRDDVEKMLKEIQTENKKSPSASQLNSKAIMNTSNVIVGYDNSDSQFFPPIGNQLSVGSCTTWAAGYYAHSYIQAKTDNVDIKSASGARYLCSPSFVYPYVNGGIDGGAFLIQAYETLSDFGCASLQDSPYSNLYLNKDPKSSFDPMYFPSVDLQKKALKNKIRMINLISDFPLKDATIANIKQALKNGDIVSTQLIITVNFMAYNGQPVSDLVSCPDGSSKRFTYPNKVVNYYDESCGGSKGAHAMAIVGYDDDKKAFKIANSWGPTWGDKGFVWVAYDLFKDPKFSVYYFLTSEDYPTETILKSYMVVDSEIDQLPTDTTKFVPIFYSADSDYVKWDISLYNFLPQLIRKVGSKSKNFSLVHDLSDYLVANKDISGQSPLKLSTTFVETPSTQFAVVWKNNLDTKSVLTLKNVKFFTVDAGVETELTPLSWSQSDVKEARLMPNITYSANTLTFKQNEALEIKPEEGSVVPADTNCTTTATLPAGVSLNASTCVISGTPTELKLKGSITVTAKNSAGSKSAKVNFEVVQQNVNIEYENKTYNLTVGTVASVVPKTLFAADSCSITPSIASSTYGVTFDTAKCTLTGTPLKYLVSKTYTVKAKNKVTTKEVTFDLSIADIVPKINYPSASMTLIKNKELVMPSTANAKPLSPAIAPTELSPISAKCTLTPPGTATFFGMTGLFFDKTTCSIYGTPSKVLPKTTFVISAENTAGKTEYKLELEILLTAPAPTPEPTPKTVVADANIEYDSKTMNLFVTQAASIKPKTLTSIDSCTISPMISFALYGISFDTKTCEIKGTPIKVLASKTYTVTAKNKTIKKEVSFDLSIAELAPSINYATSSLVLTKGDYLNVSPGAKDLSAIKPTELIPKGIKCSIAGPKGESLTTLAGLSFDTKTCMIYGSASKLLDKTTVTISLKNSAGTKEYKMDIEIKNVAPKLKYVSSAYSFGRRAFAYIYPSELIPTSTTGRTCTISPETLPEGLTFNASYCRISGTTKSAFTKTDFTVTTTTTGGTATASFSLEVK
jgi:hypothetical protein